MCLSRLPYRVGEIAINLKEREKEKRKGKKRGRKRKKERGKETIN